MPATYNVARINEIPIPPVHYTNARVNENAEEASNEEELCSSENSDSAQIDVKHESFQFELDAADASALDEIFTVDNDSIVSDLDIELNENVDNDCESNEDVEVENASRAESNDIFENNGDAPLTSSTAVVTNRITQKIDDSDDDDFEITFTSAADFQPYVVQDGYIIKLNDLLTDSLPFKLNVIPHSLITLNT